MLLPKALMATSEPGGRWSSQLWARVTHSAKPKPSLLLETVGQPARVLSSNAYDCTSPRRGGFGLFYCCFARNRPIQVEKQATNDNSLC